MPRRNLPPMNALAAFEVAARLGGFTKAASELGVAQPSVTRHVHQLEQWMGAPLFIRDNNRLTLTRAGETLSETATAMLDKLELSVAEIRDDARNEVRLACSFGMAHCWLMPRLYRLRARAPEVDLELMTSASPIAFDATDVDLSIRFGAGDWPGRASRMLIPEVVTPVAAPDFLERRGLTADLTAEDYTPERLLHHDRGENGWLTWPRWFTAKGLTPPDFGTVRYIRNYSVLIEAAVAGEGIILGTHGLVENWVERGALIPLADPISPPDRGYYIVHRPGAQNRAEVAAVRDWLIEEAADHGQTRAVA